MTKPRSNFKLTEEAKEMLRRDAEARGISMTARMETLIRENCQPGQAARDRFAGDVLRRYDEGKRAEE